MIDYDAWKCDGNGQSGHSLSIQSEMAIRRGSRYPNPLAGPIESTDETDAEVRRAWAETNRRMAQGRNLSG